VVEQPQRENRDSAVRLKGHVIRNEYKLSGTELSDWQMREGEHSIPTNTVLGFAAGM